MTLRRRHLWTALVVLAATALVVVVMLPDRVEVESALIGRGLLRVTVDDDGETRVRDRFVVGAPVTGRMTRLTCEVGDSITAGDVIARIHPLPLDTRARLEASAQLEAVEASRRAADAAVAQAETQWRDALDLRSRLDRVAAADSRGVAQRELEQVHAAERLAAQALEEARSAADAAAHQVDVARASLLDAAGAGTSEPTLVRAPASGRVLRLHEVCERVVSAGSPIVEIGDTRDIEAVIDVLTADAARLRPGALAFVTAGADADTMTGRIDRIEPSAFTRVSPLGVEEQRVNVVVRFESPPPSLGDRFRVEAALVAWQADDVLQVPLSALFRLGADWAVFVVDDGRARVRRIRLGQQGRTHAEVLEGLDGGERVVVFPSEAIEDGTRIR